MKKTFAILLACILALTMLAACGSGSATTYAGAGNQGESQPTQKASSQSTAPQNAPVQSSATQSAPANTFDPGRIIAVFTREEGSGTRDAFASLTGVGEEMYAEAVVESETNQILIKVEENDYAISYVSAGSLNERVKALAIDGVKPSNATIMDGSYKLQRPLLVCVTEEKEQEPLVQDFIAFMLSAEGQDISATKWTKIDVNAPAYASSGASGTLKVGGSTSVEPLMQALRQAYIACNPGVEIEISGGGSGTGISEATSGILDIGMSSRALKDAEKETLKGVNIALDGVAVIVNPVNPVTEMTIAQVKSIFTGDVTRWDKIG